jgi:hypothetical protein
MKNNKKDNRTLEEIIDSCDKTLAQCSDKWQEIGGLIKAITILSPQGERAPNEINLKPNKQ